MSEKARKAGPAPDLSSAVVKCWLCLGKHLCTIVMLNSLFMTEIDYGHITIWPVFISTSGITSLYPHPNDFSL